MVNPVLSSALTEAGIRHAFFTREGGVSTGVYRGLNGGIGSADDPAHVAENRGRMADYLDVPRSHLLSLYQIHSPNVIVVEEPWAPQQRPQADAMVTMRPGIAIGVGAADCGPILFADPDARVIGAAHSGWKGAIGGVLEATLDAMESLGARRARTIIALGPMLSQQNYEVGPEFETQFLAADPVNARFFRPGARARYPHFDLPGYIVHRLETAGAGRIENPGLCTYADEDRFYSYRRKTHRNEPDYGRLIAAIRL